MRVERANTDETKTNKPEARTTGGPGTDAGRPSPNVAGAAAHGAFSKLLDTAQQTSENHRSEKSTAAPESDSAADEAGDDSKKEVAAKAEKLGRDDQNGSSGGSDLGDDPAWTPAAVSDVTSDNKTPVPQARAILHVVDLERIVSAVRSDNFAGTKQVTIDLKNSVLDGLRIQITLTEQGNLKAEFIALNEQIRKQLEARKGELRSILKDRSIKCTDLTVRIDAPGNAVYGNAASKSRDLSDDQII